uniref:SAC domain-containing protein n=1 Tax=Ascaris lumbricoides TaxID=6252 RepID=A0A0M3IF03_ASCLU
MVYLVCNGYLPKELHDESGRISDDIAWTNILECCRFFYEHQTQAIKFNLVTFTIGRSYVKQIVASEKRRAQQTFKEQMGTANFEHFSHDMWLQTYESYGTSESRENPWQFGKASDIVERLRNITFEGAMQAIEQMVFF